MDPSDTDIIQANPIGKDLDRIRISCKSRCEENNIPYTPDTLSQLGQDGKTSPQVQSGFVHWLYTWVAVCFLTDTMQNSRFLRPNSCSLLQVFLQVACFAQGQAVAHSETISPNSLPSTLTTSSYTVPSLSWRQSLPKGSTPRSGVKSATPSPNPPHLLDQLHPPFHKRHGFAIRAIS